MSFASVVKQQLADTSAAPAPPPPTAVTWNGARSNATSGSARVDLFYAAVRGVDEERFRDLLRASYEEDALHTLKVIAYVRDCRGGKGERALGRQALKWLAEHQPEELRHNLKHYVAEYGRFDDPEALMGTALEPDALDLLKLQLQEDLSKLNDAKSGKEDASEASVSLCAKWIPSENKKLDKKLHMNKKLARRMDMTPAQLRKAYLSPLRKRLDVLERRMCAKEWAAIDFNRVPSVAMRIHGRPGLAFETHLMDKFCEWKDKLSTGEAKVNAKVLFPHQVVGEYLPRSEADELLEAQWKVLADQAAQMGDLTRTLVLSDVSASMSGRPMEVSIALGLLVSSLARDEFKDLVLTFTTEPKFHHVEGETLFERVQSLSGAPWGGSTNFAAAFREILRVAVDAKLASDQMPQRLVVVSDMQFDKADEDLETNYEALQREFRAAGYTVPQLIFWNVNGAASDSPAHSGEANVALVSGFSAAILKSVLASEEITPLQTLLNVVLDARYDRIELPPAASDGPDGAEDAVLL